RLNRIRTLRTVLVAFAAMGFGLFTAPVLTNLYLEEHFHVGSFGRGLLASLGGISVVAVLPFAAKRYDGLFRRDPAQALRLLGVLIIPAGVLVPIQWAMPNVWLFGIAGVPSIVLLMTAFTMVGPVMQGVVPYHLRGMGAALGSIYIF